MEAMPLVLCLFLFIHKISSCACAALNENATIVPISTLYSISKAMAYTYSTSFSQDEEECLDIGKVFTNGTCYKLLEQGPCQERHRLVVHKQNGGPPICRLKPCSEGYEFVRSQGKCYRMFDINRVFCSGPYYAYVDVYGDLQCSCSWENSMQVLGSRDQKCYSLFTRGLCSGNYVLVPCLLYPNYATCQPDSCVYDSSTDGTLRAAVLWENGTTVCYKLGSQGPCPEGLYFRYVEIFPGRYFFQCAKAAELGYGYAIPVNALLDECVPNNKGECVKLVFPSEDAMFHEDEPSFGYFS